MGNLSILQGIKLETIEETNYDPLPESEYSVMVTGSEMKTTQSGGQMLALQFTVVGGEFKGRTVFGNFNLVNSNPKAVEIAYRELKALTVALGMGAFPQDSAEFHNKYLNIVLGVREYQKDGATRKSNDVKKYLPSNQVAIGTGAVTSQAATGGIATVTTSKLPWQQ